MRHGSKIPLEYGNLGGPSRRICCKSAVIRKKPKRPKHPVATPSSFAFPLVRTFLLAAVGVLAASYGLWRYYAIPRPSMLRAPAPAPTEIPIEVE